MWGRTALFRRATPYALLELGAQWIPGIALLTALTLLGGSCYQPEFTSAIYRCEGYTCPIGLVCNSDKYCVQYPADGCTNGGIAASSGIFLCPGATNRCVSGYKTCTTVPTELACQPVPTVLGDLAVPNPCLPCCPK